MIHKPQLILTANNGSQFVIYDNITSKRVYKCYTMDLIGKFDAMVDATFDVDDTDVRSVYYYIPIEIQKPKFLRFEPGEVISSLTTMLDSRTGGGAFIYNLLVVTDENTFAAAGTLENGEVHNTANRDIRINKNILVIRYSSIDSRVYVFERKDCDSIWVGNRVLEEEVSGFLFKNPIKLDRLEDRISITSINMNNGIETTVSFQSVITKDNSE